MINRLKTARGVFIGSGSDGMGIVEFVDKALSLIPSKKNTPKVVYLGTATYDLEGPRINQTKRFIERGCEVISLDITDTAPAHPELERIFSTADVIVVSGGNTLYAVDRWVSLGLLPLIEQAADRGAVLAGGSAGAICWFTSGHSDSADPATYKAAMRNETVPTPPGKDESDTGERGKTWEYIRVDGLGLFPALVCPHYDRVQSNGKLRAEDFDRMTKRWPLERGLGIDHWAALALNGDGTYEVIAAPEKPGSVKRSTANGESSFAPGEGLPGVWVIDSQGRREAPVSGRVDELLVWPVGEYEADPGVDQCRKENPQPGVNHDAHAEEAVVRQ